ncbi:hypothetical protein ACIGZJ_32195 [Kitasatospora sp. NPDC052868]|uniref:hypothetical protein n=1 Tax=Kitasatospora sp. NPDC052868 TaxID=3364060 RepID=UPI0037CB94BB
MTMTPTRSTHPVPGVDPRTGQVGFRLDLPSPEGARIEVAVSFAPGAPDTGFGSEWALELTTYDSATGILTTRSGTTERIGADGWPTNGTRGVRVTPAADEAGAYQVAYPDGMVEVLAPVQGAGVLLPRQIGPGDQGLRFTYRPHGQGHALHEITRGSRPVLRLDRAPGKVTITYPDDQAAVFTLNLDSDGRIAEVTSPWPDEPQRRFGYVKSGAVSRITTLTRTGASRDSTTSYEYELATPGGASPRALTSREEEKGDGGQAVTVTRYSYTEPGYSGPGAPVQTQPADTFPPIGDTSYTYGSTVVETRDLTTARGKLTQTVTVTRRYDHLHRTVLEETTGAHAGVPRVVNRYLPPPANEVITTETWTRGTETESQETTRRFDPHGNLLEERTSHAVTRYDYDYDDADGFPRLKSKTEILDPNATRNTAQ